MTTLFTDSTRHAFADDETVACDFYQFGRRRHRQDIVNPLAATGRRIFKALMTMIAGMKLRRLHREFELQGLTYDQATDRWVRTPKQNRFRA